MRRIAYVLSLKVTWAGLLGGCALLSGCGVVSVVPTNTPAVVLAGRVQGGQQPVAGAAVQLWAAGTGGYGIGATPLLQGTVTTDANGNFSITGRYQCPTAASQVYLTATGGNPGLAAGTVNPALALMAALGPCGRYGAGYTLNPNSQIAVNEVTTVAAVYALRAFMTPAGSTVGTSATNTVGLANAFAMVNNLVDPVTGFARTTTPAGNGTVPQAELNTLADAVAPCVNSDGTGTPCAALFGAAATTAYGTPTDTIRAIYNVASSPANNVGAVYGLVTPTAPFQPTLTSAPNDWTVGIKITGGGFSNPQALAIDGDGSAWVANNGTAANTSSVTKLSSAGAFLSGTNGFTGGGMNFLKGVAIDPAGNAWLTSSGNVVKLSGSGTVLSGASGYTAGGINDPRGLAIDGVGDAWLADYGTGSVIELANDGTPLSGASGFFAGGSTSPVQVSIDNLSNVWTANANDFVVTELSHTGTVLSGSGGYSPGTLTGPHTIANDAAGDAWVSNLSGTVSELSPTGAVLSPAQGYPTCTPMMNTNPTRRCQAGFGPIQIDGQGNVWTTASYIFQSQTSPFGVTYTSGVVELSGSGVLLSGGTGYMNGAVVSPPALALDAGGNVWVTNLNNSVTILVGAGAPVVTPESVAVQGGRVGMRP